ncbi:MAG: hypothetical protein O3B13_17585 [Planctomycetota bacterium]|nr:hypothetical protein [Planctomycetota bacterium]
MTAAKVDLVAEVAIAEPPAVAIAARPASELSAEKSGPALSAIDLAAKNKPVADSWPSCQGCSTEQAVVVELSAMAVGSEETQVSLPANRCQFRERFPLAVQIEPGQEESTIRQTILQGYQS